MGFPLKGPSPASPPYPVHTVTGLGGGGDEKEGAWILQHDTFLLPLFPLDLFFLPIQEQGMVGGQGLQVCSPRPATCCLPWSHVFSSFP